MDSVGTRVAAEAEEDKLIERFVEAAVDRHPYPDVMVDLETTDTDVGRGAILQIAAVKFDLVERKVCSTNMFDRCLTIPPTRRWNESTREWWTSDEKIDIVRGLIGRAEPYQDVLRDFADWCGRPGSLTFWSKPLSFDYMFLQSYFGDYMERRFPFNYWESNDMNTFRRALAWPDAVPRKEPEIEFVGPAHNAIFDVLHQIKLVFHYTDKYKGAPDASNA